MTDNVAAMRAVGRGVVSTIAVWVPIVGLATLSGTVIAFVVLTQHGRCTMCGMTWMHGFELVLLILAVVSMVAQIAASVVGGMRGEERIALWWMILLCLVVGLGLWIVQALIPQLNGL